MPVFLVMLYLSIISLLFISSLLLSQLIQSEEQESNRDKCRRKNADPHQYTGDTLGFQVHKEVGINQRRGGSGNQNRRIKLQNDCLNQEKCHVSKGEHGGSDGIIPLCLFTLIEQKPVCNEHNRKYDMEAQAADAPVRLGIAAFCSGKHNVEHKEGEQNAKYSNKFQHGGRRNVAVFVLPDGLNQRSEHNTNAEEIADICEVNIEIPTDLLNVIENTQACNYAHKTECAINGLKNQLCCSVFNHNYIPL